MRKILLTAAAVAAFSCAGVANAAVSVDSTDIGEVDGPADLGDTTTIGFTEAGLSTPTFSKYLTFTNTVAGNYFMEVTTSSPNIDFTSILLSGEGGLYNFNPVATGSTEFWNLEDLFLSAGQYTLTINGNNRGTGVLDGSITIAQAVPEPATWAMMLFGFGAVGFGMRRRRSADKGKVRVRFAL